MRCIATALRRLPSPYRVAFARAILVYNQLMAERPHVNQCDSIKVGNLDCVVSAVRPPEMVQFAGDIEVVFNSQKPTNHDAEWTVKAWALCKRPDFDGYADKYSRLREPVALLRRGRGR